MDALGSMLSFFWMPRLPLLSPAAEAWAAFAETPNFTKAAKRLRLSQPALHAKITRFQHDVGQRLYNREGATIVVTPYGAALADLVRSLASSRDAFDRQAGDSSKVALIAGPGTYTHLLGKAIETIIRDASPNRLSLELSIGHGDGALSAVRRGHADLAISAFPDPPGDLHVEELDRFDQMVVMPATHRLATEGSVSLRELTEWPLILAPQGHSLRDGFELALAAASVSAHDIDIAIETEGWDMMVRFAEMGVGLAVVHGYVRVPAGVALVPLEAAPVAYQVVTRAPILQGSPVHEFVSLVRADIRWWHELSQTQTRKRPR